jgi:hypothetical protein
MSSRFHPSRLLFDLEENQIEPALSSKIVYSIYRLYQEADARFLQQRVHLNQELVLEVVWSLILPLIFISHYFCPQKLPLKLVKNIEKR